MKFLAIRLLQKRKIAILLQSIFITLILMATDSYAINCNETFSELSDHQNQDGKDLNVDITFPSGPYLLSVPGFDDSKARAILEKAVKNEIEEKPGNHANIIHALAYAKASFPEIQAGLKVIPRMDLLKLAKLILAFDHAYSKFQHLQDTFGSILKASKSDIGRSLSQDEVAEIYFAIAVAKERFIDDDTIKDAIKNSFGKCGAK